VNLGLRLDVVAQLRAEVGYRFTSGRQNADL
jgi:hypothetical protein